MVLYTPHVKDNDDDDDDKGYSVQNYARFVRYKYTIIVYLLGGGSVNI